MTRQDHIEAVARAICLARGFDPDDEKSGAVQWTAYDQAAAAISALEKCGAYVGEGWVAVPREPTNAMISEGIIERHTTGVPEAWSKATANIYRAMISAAPKPTQR